MNDQSKHGPRRPGLDRRGFFVASGLALGAVGLGGLLEGSTAVARDLWPPSPHFLLRNGDVILFQGDSITDFSRDRGKGNLANNQAALGTGYAWLAAAGLLVAHPQAHYSIFNRGISGNKVFQLAERWQSDCLDLKPNLLSILIGVNDLWHTLTGKYNGTVEIYERDYRALLERTRKALPKVKLVICEPYVLRFGAVNDKWFPAFDDYRAVAKRMAGSFDAVFIPYQSMFDEAVKYAAPERWLRDGVHPTSDGASLMAYNWLRTVAGK